MCLTWLIEYIVITEFFAFHYSNAYDIIYNFLKSIMKVIWLLPSTGSTKWDVTGTPWHKPAAQKLSLGLNQEHGAVNFLFLFLSLFLFC